jgi:hypothetical protein
MERTGDPIELAIDEYSTYGSRQELTTMPSRLSS